MCQQSVVAGVFLWAPHTVSIVVAILFSSHSQCCLFNLHAVCFKSDCQHVHWCVCVSLIVGSLNISGWLWFWKGKVNVFWLCVSVCICVNLFVCPSHVSVVGHGWIRRVTKKKNKTEQNSPPTSFSISPVYALRHSFKWCLTLLCPPPTPHTPNSSQTPHPSTHAHSPHFSMIPSETAACFLPLKRLKTQTVWVPPAVRLKIPKPGCTLSLPVVMATSLLITTACFHWDVSGPWNWLISETCSTVNP